jgi:hypothetical protein
VLGDRVEADGRCCRLSGGFTRLFAFLLFLCRREEVRGGGCEFLELAQTLALGFLRAVALPLIVEFRRDVLVLVLLAFCDKSR